MSFYKLLIISNLWGYLTACHAGGREFEPRPHRRKGNLLNVSKLPFLFFVLFWTDFQGFRQIWATFFRWRESLPQALMS